MALEKPRIGKLERDKRVRDIAADGSSASQDILFYRLMPVLLSEVCDCINNLTVTVREIRDKLP